MLKTDQITWPGLDHIWNEPTKQRFKNIGGNKRKSYKLY
jgi:hypothetical protein